MKYKPATIGIMMVIVSFLGFFAENVWLAITNGYINNRNMNLPFLLGYGLAMLAIYLLFGIPSQMTFFSRFSVKAPKGMKIFLYFLCVMLCVSLGEIILGTATERFCCIEYWNYEWLPLHITKYTSIPTSLGFAAIVTVFMDRIFPPLMNEIARFDGKVVHVTALVLITVLVIDFLYCYGHMMKTHDFYRKWKVPIRPAPVSMDVDAQDLTDEEAAISTWNLTDGESAVSMA